MELSNLPICRALFVASSLLLASCVGTETERRATGLDPARAGDVGSKADRSGDPEAGAVAEDAPSDPGEVVPPVDGDAPDSGTTSEVFEDGDGATGAPDADSDSDAVPAEVGGIALVTAATCVNPCTFSAVSAGPVATVAYDGDGWHFATGLPPEFSVTYTFTGLGERVVTATAYGVDGQPLATDSKTVWVTAPAPQCTDYTSDEEEFAPIQTTGAGLPDGAAELSWTVPTTYVYLAPFTGSPGQPAVHEGHDYVHDDQPVVDVPVWPATAGTVAYVRLGCPQSTMFGHNTALRECGSGWGNYVVVDHGGGIYTRYGHLAPQSVLVQVGDSVEPGDVLAEMGNSGRSEVRHLHFELGSAALPPDPCAPAQSFDLVYDPTGVGL